MRLCYKTNWKRLVGKEKKDGSHGDKTSIEECENNRHRVPLLGMASRLFLRL